MYCTLCLQCDRFIHNAFTTFTIPSLVRIHYSLSPTSIHQTFLLFFGVRKHSTWDLCFRVHTPILRITPGQSFWPSICFALHIYISVCQPSLPSEMSIFHCQFWSREEKDPGNRSPLTRAVDFRSQNLKMLYIFSRRGYHIPSGNKKYRG